MQPVNRVCKKCHLIKVLEEFTLNKNCLYGREHKCRVCTSDNALKWERENTEPRKKIYVSYKFGKNKVDYRSMYSAQGGKCAICNAGETRVYAKTGKILDLCIDHDHRTGKVRELLCNKCNKALGMLQDSVSILESAIRYLQKHI